MHSAGYSLQSCREWRVISIGFHSRAGATSSFMVLQGEPALQTSIAQYLLEPPQAIADKFVDVLTGPAVELKDGRQTVCRRQGAEVTHRSQIASAGAEAVDAGLVRWTARCSGHSFAVGIISDDRWHMFEKDNSFDWPFVGQGVGQGYGVVARRGSLYIAKQSPATDYWNCNCAPDFATACQVSGTNEFSVVLDVDRARVFFEQDGVKILGSVVELPEPSSSYRFIASVPDAGCSVTLIGT